MKEKADPVREGAHPGISFEFEYLGKFKFLFETALGYLSECCEHVLIKKPEANFTCVSVPLSPSLTKRA